MFNYDLLVKHIECHYEKEFENAFRLGMDLDVTPPGADLIVFEWNADAHLFSGVPEHYSATVYMIPPDGSKEGCWIIEGWEHGCSKSIRGPEVLWDYRERPTAEDPGEVPRSGHNRHKRRQ